MTEFPVPLRKEERTVRDITVFIVEDDPMVLDIHRRFLLSVPGFRVVGTAGNGARALDFLSRTAVDLVILDIFMPEMDGLEVVERLRAVRKSVDVIIISAAHEAGVIKDVVRSGVFDYLVKPFTFERFRAALDAYRDLMRRVQNGQGEFSQEDIDGFFLIRNRKNIRATLPKGLNANMLGRIEELLRNADAPLSADEAATGAGISRVTARRYLEHLVATGKAEMERCYGEVGRPLNKYRLLP